MANNMSKMCIHSFRVNAVGQKFEMAFEFNPNSAYLTSLGSKSESQKMFCQFSLHSFNSHEI